MLDTHIIIVNYNAGAWLQRSVLSALRCSSALVTVVDNASSDTSFITAKANITDDRVNWQLNAQNLGFAAANNQILKNITAEYSVLLNPDCELQENTLAEVIKHFDIHPKLGLASCKIVDENGEVQATSKRYFPTPWSAFVRLLRLHKLFPNNPKFANFDYGDVLNLPTDIEWVEAVSGAFMVVRLKALRDVGLLDEGYFMHCEDLDWCKRFQLSGWAVGYIPSTNVIHAKGVSSASRPIGVLWALHKGVIRFFNKFYFAQTPFILRFFVKLGVSCSFIVRASYSILKGLMR